MPADNPVDAIKQDLQRLTAALGGLRGTLATQQAAAIGGRLPAGLDPAFRNLILELDSTASKMEDDLTKLSGGFVRFAWYSRQIYLPRPEVVEEEIPRQPKKEDRSLAGWSDIILGKPPKS